MLILTVITAKAWKKVKLRERVGSYGCGSQGTDTAPVAGPTSWSLWAAQIGLFYKKTQNKDTKLAEGRE